MALDQDHRAAARRPLRQAGEPSARGRPFRARGPMLVEFLGIAGSGKTVICSALAARLRRAGLTVITRDDYFAWLQQPRYRKISYVVINGPRTWHFIVYSYRFLYYSAGLRGHALVKMAYHLAYMHVWLSRTLSQASSLAVLLDQFAWHRLINQLMERPFVDLPGDQLARTVALFYPRCEAHWVLKTTPVDLAVRRISRRHVRENRAPWLIEKRPADRQQALLQRQAQLYRRVCDGIRRRHVDKVHCVDGTAPISAQIRHLERMVTGSLPPERRAASIERVRLSA